MSSSSSSDSERATAFRRLPSVHALVEHVGAGDRADGLPRPIVVDAARAVLETCRSELGGPGAGADIDVMGVLADRVIERLARRPTLAPVINATGIVIHTGLGRAPLAPSAVSAAADAARRYVPVELDMTDGSRGRRSLVVRQTLCRLTGAESATVVNNNAAALVLVLSTMARGRSVVVSRGELVEIGGSFRIPDIMSAGGVALREVGTTNRTRLEDYERAVDEDVAALMKVHPANFRQVGFVQSVPIDDLVEAGRRHGLPVIDDIGSGALCPTEAHGWPSDEPSASASVAAGADVVLFSGDKLLGGPQAGIIVGRAEWIDRLERNPLMRAMRVDKIRLAALAATLELHLDRERAARELPVIAMLTRSVDDVRRRAEALADRLRGAAGASIDVRDSVAYLGGGSVPAESVPSAAIVVRSEQRSEQALADRLRHGSPPVVGRVSDGAVWLDLRTVMADEEEALVEAIRRCL